MENRRKHKDFNQIAKFIVDSATKEQKENIIELHGQAGGLKGGQARANSLSPKRRSEIAKKAALKRWANN